MSTTTLDYDEYADMSRWYELILFALVLGTGMIGGCSAAGYFVARNGKITWWMAAAYAILGGFLAGIFYAFHGYIPFFEHSDSLTMNLGYSLLVGFVGSISLMTTNLGAKIVLKKLGIEVMIDVKKIKKVEKK